MSMMAWISLLALLERSGIAAGQAQELQTLKSRPYQANLVSDTVFFRESLPLKEISGPVGWDYATLGN